MRKRLVLVSEDSNEPVFYNQKEHVFCVFNLTKKSFDVVPCARIINDPGTVYKSMTTYLDAFIENQLKDRRAPTDVGYDFSYCKSKIELRPKIIPRHFVYPPPPLKGKEQKEVHKPWYVQKTKTYWETGSQCFIPNEQYDAIADSFMVANYYLGLYDFLRVRGDLILAITVVKLIGQGKVVTPDSLRDGHAVGETNPKYWHEGCISWTDCNNLKFYGIIKKLSHDKIDLITSMGEKKSVLYDNPTIVKENIIPSEQRVENKLSKSVNENFATSLDDLKLFKSKMKIMVVDEPFLTGNNRSEELCASCPNCGIVMKEKADGFFACIMCNQAAKLVHQEDDVGLFMLGEVPNKYSFALEESKCCGNCGLSNFPRNSAGFMRLVGNCDFTNQIIQPHNVCPRWKPIRPNMYKANMKRNSTNFRPILRTLQNQQRGVDTIQYNDKDSYSSRSKQMMDLAASYELAFIDWTKKIVEKSKNLPIADV